MMLIEVSDISTTNARSAENQGIDLEVGGTQGEPGVTPHDILNGPNVVVIVY